MFCFSSLRTQLIIKEATIMFTPYSYVKLSYTWIHKAELDLEKWCVSATISDDVNTNFMILLPSVASIGSGWPRALSGKLPLQISRNRHLYGRMTCAIFLKDRFQCQNYQKWLRNWLCVKIQPQVLVAVACLKIQHWYN